MDTTKELEIEEAKLEKIKNEWRKSAAKINRLRERLFAETGINSNLKIWKDAE